MTRKSIVKKGKRWQSHWIMMALFAFSFGSCVDEESKLKEATPFDPTKAVVISDFIPEEGGVGQRLVIFGDNFGNNPEAIQVFIGGREAKVIGVQGESLYCIVPIRAFSGEIEIRIGDKVGTIEKPFEYLRNTIVSTVIGYKTDRDDQGWKDGVFNKNEEESNMASGFRNDGFFKFDPTNPKHLWATYDNHNGLYLINFEDSTVTRTRADLDRPRSIDFSLDQKYMILSEDRGNENDPSNYILSREDGFRERTPITRYKQCNGSAVHPVNGELYFNSYDQGQLYRFDLMEYIAAREAALNPIYPGVKDYEYLFSIHDPQWEYRIIMHPSGDYAYIVVINQHYIMRVDYNWEEERFGRPTLVCGQPRQAGWVDGVGATARLDRPYQGVFVKNPKYVAGGKEDEYDFYFTDCMNHCVRKLTPAGVVTTFAGRGSASLNPDPWGYVDGDARQEARFNQPSGIAYDEIEGAFYISDKENRRIRKMNDE